MPYKKPNILFIMVDELAPQALPCHGHPVVQTPNIDRLACEGVVFENAYTNSPICAPARAAMMTGRHTPTIGAFDNGTEIPTSTPTMAHYLRAAGYEATLSGKMHFIGPDQLHGFQRRLTTDIYPANFAWTANWQRPPTAPNPAGVTVSPVLEAGPCIRSMQIDYDDEVEHVALQELHDLARRPSDAPPFFLTVSFTHPHPPFTCGQEHWDLYDHDAIDMPKVGPIAEGDMDEASRYLYFGHRRDRFTVTDAAVRNARHAYYGMISYIDDKVGRLMDALEQLGMSEDTIVVFTSDHGEMLGERSMWFKMNMFEWSVRVPMIFWAPGKFSPKRVKENVSLVDLLPTFTELGHGPAPEDFPDEVDGNSMVKLLTTGTDEAWPDVAISDYTANATPGPVRMIRRGPFKLIHIPDNLSLLFNLDDDPDELNNLANQAAHQPLLEELKAIAFRGYDPEQVSREVRTSQRRRLFIRDSADPNSTDSNWAYVARPGDEDRFVRSGGIAKGENATKALARFPYVEPPLER
ncbi:MAG: choline-sulfatase [Rhodospirillaceae bacterium]|nr:choline-sulfatase [Rhodospirillaceae bacterium]